jgi:hypothetical protein
MLMLRNWLSGAAAFVLGVSVGLTLLDLGLQFLPVQGAYGAEPDAGWPAHHMIPNSRYTFSAGWNMEDVRHGHINNMGYAAPFDYQPGTAANVVIGDSFVENLMNDYSESLQGILPALLKQPVPVLGFGMSGANLAHDLGVAALVGDRFKVKTAVILITRGSFLGGFNSSPGYYRWTESPAGVEFVPERYHGRVAQFVRTLALVRYARGNLRADLGQLLEPRGRGVKARCLPAVLSASDEAQVNFVVRELPLRLHVSASEVILVFDTDREAIYAPHAPVACPTRDGLALQLLAKRATASGFEVIDMDPIFRAAFRTNGQHFDYLPVDAHWNGAAQRLAAQEVARYINAHQVRAPMDARTLTSR